MPKEDYCVLLISNDKYQLPLAAADNIGELAKMTGLSRRNLQGALHTGKPVLLPESRYDVRKGLVIRVKIEEKE